MLHLVLLFLFYVFNAAPSLSGAREGRRACRHAPREWHLQPRLCLGRLNNDGHSAASGHDWPMLMPRINGYLLFVRVIKGMQPVTGRTDSHCLTAIGHRFCPLCCLSVFCSRTLFVVFIKWYFSIASSFAAAAASD